MKNSASRFDKTWLDDGKAMGYIKKLDHLMKRQKPYLDSRLTLADLAEMISIPTQYMSQILNEYMQENYFDYINRWRIAEAETIIRECTTKKLNIDEVGRKAGFYSPASFQEAFLKLRGMTPGEFMEKNFE